MAEPDPLESRITTLAALLRQIWRGIAKGFATTLTSQGTVTMSDANHVRQQWTAQVGGAVLTHIGKTYLDGAETVAELFDNGVDEPIGEDQVQAYLEQATNRLRGVGDDVWKNVRTQIKLGTNAGESIEEIASRVRNVAEMTVGRSTTIARTETHAAYESGAYEQALFVDPSATKVWVATKDTKTRETHKDANGQQVPISGSFTVGGAALKFPGDPLGGGESISCRCTVFYEFAEVETPVESLALAAAGGGWKPHQHPRGNDGKFIKKGAVSDVLSKGKLNLGDVESAAASIVANPQTWNTLTDAQQSYISEQVKKLPSSFTYDTVKKNFEAATAQAAASAGGGKSPAPKTTKISPNLQQLAKNAVDGQIIATGVKNDKKFRVSVLKGDYVNTYNPDGKLKLEFLKKDGTVSAVGGKIGSAFTIIDSVQGYYSNKPAKVAWNLPPGQLHHSIADVLDNASDPHLGGSKYMTGTKLTLAWKAAAQEGHWDALTFEQQSALVDVTFSRDNQNKLPMNVLKDAEAHKEKLAEASAPASTPAPDEDVILLLGNEALDDFLDLSPYAVGDVVAQSDAGEFVKKTAPDSVTYYDAGGNEVESLIVSEYTGSVGDLVGQNDVVGGNWVVTPPEKKTPPDLNTLKQMMSGVDLTQYAEIGDVVAKSSEGDFIKKTYSNDYRLYTSANMTDGTAAKSTNGIASLMWKKSQENNSTWEILSPTSALPESTSLKDVAKTHLTAPSSPSVKVPAGLKGKPGDPAKVTTGVVWGKHPAGTTIIEKPSGTEKFVWNGKKYDHFVGDQLVESLSKKDFYAQQKDQTGWVIPGGATTTTTTTATPAVDTEVYKSGQSLTLKEGKKYLIDTTHSPGTVVGLSATKTERLVATGKPPMAFGSPSYSREIKHPTTGEWHPVDMNISGIGAIQLLRGADMSSSAEKNWLIPQSVFNVTATPSPEALPTPVASTPAAIPVLPIDFTSFKKVGAQSGSNPGGVYEAPTGEEWYLKKPKSELHANNEVAASTFYQLAGIDAPLVMKGAGASGLGESQTGTKIVPGAKANLKAKLSDPAYVKQLQAGFAMDAWLANWDVAGLTFDNVVQGADGKPHRIDVGGALLFRAQGMPKGAAFGDVVTEIDTLRDAGMNPQSAKIFGSMTDAEIAESVKLVAAFDDQKIDTVVQDAKLPQSVAETLKKRRDDLVSKYLSSADDALYDQFTTSGMLTSPSDFMTLAKVIEQKQWDALSDVDKKTILDEVHEFGQAALNEGDDKTWQQANTFEQKLINFNDGVNPAAGTFGSFPPVKKGAKKAKKVPGSASPELGESDKELLLEDAENQILTLNEAISLVNSLTADDVKNLSPKQTQHIAMWVHSAAKANTSGGILALDKWNALKTIDVTAANPSGGVGEKLTGGPVTLNDFIAVIEDAAPHGTVVAVAQTGDSRILWHANSNSFTVQEFHTGDGEWIDNESYDVSGDLFTPDEIIDNMLHDWSFYTWQKPTTGDLTAPPPSAQPVAVPSESVIENWPGVLKSGSPDTVLAVTPDGKYKITPSAVSTALFDVHVKGSNDLWHIATVVNVHSVADVVQGFSKTWVVPPKTTAPPKINTNTVGKISTKVAFAAGLVSGLPDEIIVEGVNPDVTQFKYRLRVTGKGENKHIVLEAQNKAFPSAPWISMVQYYDYAHFAKDWPSDPFIWNPVTSEQSADSPIVTPPMPGPTPTPPVAPTATSSLGDGVDIAGIPYYHKAKFKNVLKAQGNTGYWSKPEKIWDAVKAIQAEYPDPNNPGASKYTPAQILKVLDSQTNTKSSAAPYSDKVTKWVSTAKGSKYVGGTGSVNPVQVSTDPSPAQLAATLWANASTTKTGTVVATGTLNGGSYQIQNGTSPNGAPGFILYYLSSMNSWQYYYSINDQDELQNTLSKYGMKGTADSGVPLVQTAVPKTKPPGPLPNDVSSIAQVLGEEKGDISHLTEESKQSVYAAFKKQPSTYLSSPPKDIFVALKHIADDNGMSLLQALRVVDDVGAKKVKKPNEYLFEKKIKDWLKTPKGVASALGQPVPKPPRPEFKANVSTANIPSFADSDKYSYTSITTQKANGEWAKMIAQSGPWTGAESSGLKSYTGGIYFSINGYLYGEYDTISPTNEKAMKNAQLGMRPSVSPILLHRGVGYNGIANSSNHDDLAKKVGQTWRNDGFSSSSVGGKAAFSGNPVILEIEAPPGTPMAWLKPISQFSTENEMLLAAGLNFKIMSVKKSGYQSIVRLRVVPDEETA